MALKGLLRRADQGYSGHFPIQGCFWGNLREDIVFSTMNSSTVKVSLPGCKLVFLNLFSTAALVWSFSSRTPCVESDLGPKSLVDLKRAFSKGLGSARGSVDCGGQCTCACVETFMPQRNVGHIFVKRQMYCYVAHSFAIKIGEKKTVLFSRVLQLKQCPNLTIEKGVDTELGNISDAISWLKHGFIGKGN
ncbi:unnamed protein product [Ixodes pacificus]